MSILKNGIFESVKNKKLIKNYWMKLNLLIKRKEIQSLNSINGVKSYFENSFNHPEKVLEASWKKGSFLLNHDIQLGSKLLKGHTANINAVSFSPTGNLASCSDDNTIRVWDSFGNCILILKEHTGPVVSISYSSDGSKLLSASIDSTARIWDADSGDCLHVLFHLPGLLIQGCNFQNLHGTGTLSQKQLFQLNKYGGIFNNEHKNHWRWISKEHFNSRIYPRDFFKKIDLEGNISDFRKHTNISFQMGKRKMASHSKVKSFSSHVCTNCGANLHLGDLEYNSLLDSVSCNICLTRVPQHVFEEVKKKWMED